MKKSQYGTTDINPYTWEAEAGESETEDQLGLHIKVLFLNNHKLNETFYFGIASLKPQQHINMFKTKTQRGSLTSILRDHHKAQLYFLQKYHPLELLCWAALLLIHGVDIVFS